LKTYAEGMNSQSMRWCVSVGVGVWIETTVFGFVGSRCQQHQPIASRYGSKFQKGYPSRGHSLAVCRSHGEVKRTWWYRTARHGPCKRARFVRFLHACVMDRQSSHTPNPTDKLPTISSEATTTRKRKVREERVHTIHTLAREGGSYSKLLE